MTSSGVTPALGRLTGDQPGASVFSSLIADRLKEIGDGSDYWIKTGKLWMRIHVKPRHCMFIPTGAVGGPVPEQLLKGRRTVAADSTGTMRIINDVWRGSGAASVQDKIPDLTSWTGFSEFVEKDEEPLGRHVWEDRTGYCHAHSFPVRMSPDNVEHLLIHKPADERCEHCMRGKLRNPRNLGHSFRTHNY